jgi:hypothetical protein
MYAEISALEEKLVKAEMMSELLGVKSGWYDVIAKSLKGDVAISSNL